MLQQTVQRTRRGLNIVMTILAYRFWVTARDTRVIAFGDSPSEVASRVIVPDSLVDCTITWASPLNVERSQGFAAIVIRIEAG